MTRVPVSILDRANTRAGGSEADALASVIDRARSAEDLGYRRFWVAEHHGVPGIAGSAPTVLMAAIAARTDEIRVGSGGVMLPNHQPLVVAEQAATLESLHPGRIDLGVGRSVGFTAAVRKALRQDADAPERFAEDLAELMAHLEGTAAITARPRNQGVTPLFVLATGKGLEYAAAAGLGVVVGGPTLFGGTSDGTHPDIARYRATFRPSSWFARPHVIVAANIAAAETREAARDLLVPEAWALAQSRTKGEFPPLEDPKHLATRTMTRREQTMVQDYLDNAIYGTADDARRQVTSLVDFTGADELMVTGGMYEPAGRERSDLLVSELFEE